MKPGRATVSYWLREMMLECGLGVSKAPVILGKPRWM